jgi:hypothetical protein
MRMNASDEDKPKGVPRGRPRTDGRDDPVIAGLRRLWNDVENEPVPDEFLALLEQIEKGADAPAAPAEPKQ